MNVIRIDPVIYQRIMTAPWRWSARHFSLESCVHQSRLLWKITSVNVNIQIFFLLFLSHREVKRIRLSWCDGREAPGLRPACRLQVCPGWRAAARCGAVTAGFTWEESACQTEWETRIFSGLVQVRQAPSFWLLIQSVEQRRRFEALWCDARVIYSTTPCIHSSHIIFYRLNLWYFSELSWCKLLFHESSICLMHYNFSKVRVTL